MNTVTTHPSTLTVSSCTDIYLRLLALEDADELYELIDADREHLQTFQRWTRDVTRESLTKTISDNLEKAAADEWLQYRIMFRESSGDRIIGNITFYNHDAVHNVANLGYWIAQPYEGKGYVYAAAQTALAYAFKEWGVRKVVLVIDAENERSEHLAEKLGAKLTDRLEREEIHGQTYNDRVWEIVQ